MWGEDDHHKIFEDISILSLGRNRGRGWIILEVGFFSNRGTFFRRIFLREDFFPEDFSKGGFFSWGFFKGRTFFREDFFEYDLFNWWQPYGKGLVAPQLASLAGGQNKKFRVIFSLFAKKQKLFGLIF